MNRQTASSPTPPELLGRDRRTERRLWWKGLLAIAVVLVLAYVRHRWWL